jgi:isopentenyl-diphosphate delta-isomerase
MKKVTQTSSRKSDHIRINNEENVQSGLTTGLEKYHFIHEALPEIDLEQVDTSQIVFTHKLNAPLLISSMTGGTTKAAKINYSLAEAAQEAGIAMGVGSQRAAIESSELSSTFQVRHIAPNILLFANLGAVQLNYGYGKDECQRAVDMIEANALILHLNALQEAVQPEGDTRFSNLLSKIEAICRVLPVPVIAKEVGWGFSKKAAQQLISTGVSAIDVAGAGGTSWSQVEMYRAQTSSQVRIASAFSDWGIPTVRSIKNVRSTGTNIPIFASGGLRNGIDIAKCIALGATLGGIAGPFLRAAMDSTQTLLQAINDTIRELRISMFASGAGTLSDLTQDKLITSTIKSR